MNLDYYKTFYYVALSKNFTKAAELLGNNQPNVTRSMNNLEAELGMPTVCEKQQRGIVDTDWRTTISVCVGSHE